MFIENATTGSQSINISQGSGANVTIATGKTAVVYLDGAGSGAAVVDAMALVDPGVTDTLAEVLVAGNTTGGTNIVFGDSSGASDDRLVFGAGSDLQIYHDGAKSVISDQGTGNLVVFATDLGINNAAGTQSMLAATDGGNVRLYFAGNQKLATTSTGADLTGTLTADGLTVDGSAAFNLGSGEEVSIYRSTDYAVLRLGASSTDHWSFQEAGTNSLYIGCLLYTSDAADE